MAPATLRTSATVRERAKRNTTHPGRHAPRMETFVLTTNVMPTARARILPKTRFVATTSASVVRPPVHVRMIVRTAATTFAIPAKTATIAQKTALARPASGA